jgi:5'-AMP-activated protein kinase, regulatory gamma subunit
MEGNPEAESVRGGRPFEPKAEVKAPADVDLPSEPQGFQGHLEVTDEAQVEDPAKAHVKSWIDAQSETQPQQPPSEPPTGDAEGDNAVGQLPRVKNDASSTVPGVIGTTAGSASTMTSAPGTDRPTPAPPAAEAGVGVVAGPALITPRGRAASTSTDPSITAAGHGHVPQFVAPSSYLRCRTSIRSPMAPTKPKPLSPLDRDQMQGLVCVRLFVSL